MGMAQAIDVHEDSAERRRILLLSQDLDIWGAQRQIVELAKGLARHHHDVRLGALAADGPLRAELIEHGIPVESFARRWRWDLSPIARLASYLRSQRIEVVHAFMFLPNFYSRLAGRWAGTPAVISSLRSTGIEGWPRYAADVATCFLCDAMIANSAAGRDHYLRRGGLRSRMAVVRNGWAPRRAVPEPAAAARRRDWGLQRFRQLIGMVGALEWRKDQRRLIEAMVEISRSAPDTGLVLAGDGSRRRPLGDLAQSLGLGDRVVFLGTLANPDPLYDLLDVYVQASFEGEGISNSILEAMAHARPVIATDVGGNREVVADQRTGILIPPGDAAALAGGVLALLADDARRQRMGRAGAARVQQEFGLETMIEATESIYDAVLRRRTE